jgi:hypothetical protein
LEGKTSELEREHELLTDRSNSLAKTLWARESALAQSEQKIASLTDRTRAIEAAAQADRAQAERRVEELNETLERERTAAREALEGKTSEFEQERASLIERSKGLTEALEMRESALAQSEQKIASLTDRTTAIEAAAQAYRAQVERYIGELNETLERERAAAREALEGKTSELEREHELLIERFNSLAKTLRARESALADAEQKIESLTHHIAEIEAAARAYRAQAERHIDQLNVSLEREFEFAVAQETTRRDHALQRDMPSGQAGPRSSVNPGQISQSNGGRDAGRPRKTAQPARAIEGRPEATEPVEPVEGADDTAAFAPTQPRSPLQRPVVERLTKVTPIIAHPTRAAPSSVDAVKPASTIEPAGLGAARSQDGDRSVKHRGQITAFVSGKERKILLRQGSVPLFDMPILIEKPDQPLGTHVFTAMELTDDGSGISWELMTVSADASMPMEQKNISKGASKSARQQSSTAGEALDRIQLPKEAASRISELLIPGSSLVISDESLDQITRLFSPAT